MARSPVFAEEKNDRRVAEKFQFVADEFFVIEEQAAFVEIAETVDALRSRLVANIPAKRFCSSLFARFASGPPDLAS